MRRLKNLRKQSNKHAPATHPNLPPRTSSLHPIMMPDEAPPPIPLSRMTFEELIEVLPRLDAAIIANDWLPCMDKRQKEIKEVMQAQNDLLQATRERSNDVGENLIKKLSEAGDIAQSFHELFEIAKDLQKCNVQDWNAELEEANHRRLEAVNVLSRHVTMHKEKCAAYERQITVLQGDVKHAVRVLGSFIHENLSHALDNSPKEQIEEILAKFMILDDDDTDAESDSVSRDLYNDMERALQKAQAERDDTKDVCKEQMNLIREQSRKMDRYVTQMTKLVKSIQEEKESNSKLRLDNDTLRKEVGTLKTALDKAQLQREATTPTKHTATISQEHISSKEWSQDAEITNLRTKLTQSLDRERLLNQQIREILQSSHEKPPDKRANLFKRLLTGGTQGTEQSLFLPKGRSMHDLSHTKLYSDEDLPTLLANSSVFSDEKEIESAVSGRFHASSKPKGESVALPANVRVGGTSPVIPQSYPRVLSGITEVSETETAR